MFKVLGYIFQIIDDFQQLCADLAPGPLGVDYNLRCIITESEVRFLSADIFKGIDIAVTSERIIVTDEDNERFP